MDIAKYRKFLIAGAGFIVMILKEATGIEADSHLVDLAVEGLIAIITLVGVFAVRNKVSVPEARKSKDEVF